MNVSKTTYPLLFIIVFAAGCSDRTNDSLRDQALQWAAEARAQLSTGRSEDAERTFQRCIDAFNRLQDNRSLIEMYSAFAPLQVSLGKYAPALTSYTSLRSLIAGTGDTRAEIPVAIEIERLYERLGDPERSRIILEEVLITCQVYQYTHLHAVTALQLGHHHEVQREPAQALAYYSQAAAEFLSMKDTANFMDATAGKIACHLALGHTGNAEALAAGSESILHRNLRQPWTAAAFLRIADAFRRSGGWSVATTLYTNALVSAQRREEPATPEALIGLGEVFYQNYRYDEAQRRFIDAYNAVKGREKPVLEAYALVRIADCQVKQYATHPSQEALIRSLQFYEHAQTLFSRMHMTIGEAIVLHRIGVQKQLAGDDNAAITYYKQAVGRYLDSPMEPHSLGLSVDLDDLVSSSVRTWSPIDWLTKDLISLLLKYRRTGDAYPYESLRRSFAVQRLLYPLPAGFSDQGKGAMFSKSMELRQRRQQDALEMFYASRARNKDYLETLQRQTAATRTELDSAIATLSRKYPRFAFLRRSLASPDDGRRIPSGSTVIDYVVENNECWAFVLENGQEPVSVKISSFGWELEQTMKKFMAAYERRADADMEWLSAKLYYILIHPIERYGRQRFIFLPIPGLEKFPFHALSNNGRPLIDMIEVSYLPSVDFLGQEKRFPSFINTVVAFGFSPDPRWGLEFELRDIRSFFRNTQVFVNQSATEERLKNSFGEVLQLSTQFQTTDRTMTCTVSDGTPSTAGMNLPVSAFASLYPFPLVYLEDVQSRVNNIRPPHSIYWLLNGSSAVITTEFPSNAKMSNRFREQFYTSLEASAVPYGAYRTAVRRLADDRSPSADKNWPSYFYYGM